MSCKIQMFFVQEGAKEQFVALVFVLVIEMFLLHKETVLNSSIAVLVHLDVAAIVEVQAITLLHALIFSLPIHHHHRTHHK
jgi:hypothetical protein